MQPIPKIEGYDVRKRRNPPSPSEFRDAARGMGMDIFWNHPMDGASFCYCTYVLRTLGYLGFLRNLPTKTTIFLRCLRQCGKSRS